MKIPTFTGHRVTWNIPFTIHVKTAGVAMNRMMNIGINIGIQFNRKQNCDGFLRRCRFKWLFVHIPFYPAR